MSRWYIEKIYELLESQVKRGFGNSIPPKEFLNSAELKDRAKNNLELLIDVFEKSSISSEEFHYYYTLAINEYRSKKPTTVQQSRSLVFNVDEWLDRARMTDAGWNRDSNDSYRRRYFQFLADNGWPESVVSEAERSSLEIVKKLGDPKSETAFFRRGMVVGSVQSGKTANFNGVINSAIDTGYELIIVLSGLMEDLRKQTQRRIEKDIIGKWIGGLKYQGVGNISAFSGPSKPVDCQTPQVDSITSFDSDFNRGLLDADFSLPGTKILVCKKNVSVLGNLLLWLQEYADEKHPRIDIPLLIIDDEADNASLNNLGYNEEFDPSRTNCLIRAILHLFSRKTYLGYTATPFANLLQYRNEAIHTYHFLKNKDKENEQNFGAFRLSEDLFPEHFIELLYPPSNYVGIKSFFETREEKRRKIDDLIVDIGKAYIPHIPPRFYREDDEPTDFRGPGTRASQKYEYNEQFRDISDPNDTYPYSIPVSMGDAIKCFIVSIAIRYSRKDLMKESKLFNPHHTMLVHISRFGTWQNKLRKLVAIEVEELNNELASSRIDGDIYQDFRRIWNVYFHYIVNNIDSYLPEGYDDPFLVRKEFDEDILPLLPRASQNIEVLAVNSSPEGDDLKYGDEEKKYIAIGGNRLSRGFTLEGLTINYFLRAANTMDTLMQMGRWFGYRPGYLDCCKLFTISDNIRKFNEASLVIEDLEEKFAHLSRLPNRTPSDFTLWIQNNPDVIGLTRANFLGDLEQLSLDYGDSVKMSTAFNIQKGAVENLWNSFNRLVGNFEWTLNPKSDFVYTDTDQAGLMDFVNLDGLKEVMINLNTLGLEGYLNECREHNALKSWRIGIKLVKQGKGRELDLSDLGLENVSDKRVGFKLSQRSGPIKGAQHSVTNLVENQIFKARNSTIISSSKDFALFLTDEEIEAAELAFKEQKIAELISSRISPEQAAKDVEKISIPDRAYRAGMDSSKGVLVIYLIDYSLIFRDNDNPKVTDYAEKNEVFDFEIPLIGYALGFPTVNAIAGQTFVSRNVFKEPYEMTFEELHEFVEKKGLPIKDLDSLSEEELKSKVMEILY